jgi:hypothetical protein
MNAQNENPSADDTDISGLICGHGDEKRFTQEESICDDCLSEYDAKQKALDEASN